VSEYLHKYKATPLESGYVTREQASEVLEVLLLVVVLRPGDDALRTYGDSPSDMAVTHRQERSVGHQVPVDLHQGELDEPVLDSLGRTVHDPGTSETERGGVTSVEPEELVGQDGDTPAMRIATDRKGLIVIVTYAVADDCVLGSLPDTDEAPVGLPWSRLVPVRGGCEVEVVLPVLAGNGTLERQMKPVILLPEAVLGIKADLGPGTSYGLLEQAFHVTTPTLVLQ